MVKITKVGTLPCSKTYQARCRSCKTEFIFERKEAKYNNDQRDGDYLSITCPLEGCGKTVTVGVSPYSNNGMWNR
jgi:hypothetical protein